ncbi:hypothetical protein C900_05286 [Fulvivirga imtechensis AK7]|uniref:Uncharacterized protein n=1 Tax=Fulvivirga imtechensis AK7 TaxID=1237149 RepID=L8JK87_9BACT|nr:hypothetical protein [Fulvivirga imtechensis]ELR69215.1 hypothetical protein C900_05286 [Fulvivirga imtechensis AK7]
MKTLENLKSFELKAQQVKDLTGGTTDPISWIGTLGEITHHGAIRILGTGIALGAAFGVGFYAGSLIYDSYSTQILDGIESIDTLLNQ